jgi:glycosidase
MGKTFVKHPEWSRNASIYEINVRQYSKGGTFSAVKNDLYRIKDLGVDILWFMPIYPIGIEKRKGTLGSYYSIKNYTEVNPEFGTLDDFKELVTEAHALGFYVLLDWVANHTSWDHHWIYEHPEYYTQDNHGNILAPFDWEDVADLNYNSPGLRTSMIEEMKFWLKEVKVDGFRCDVADLVPTDFWNEARDEMNRIKNVFMLAEAELIALHIKAFNMSYASEYHKLINRVAKGESRAWELVGYFDKIKNTFPGDTYVMQFTSNHDENSWNGSVYERLGGGVKTFAVLACTVPGMPLIYDGQEAGMNKRLKFFDKDEIEWKESDMFPFYQQLISLKKTNKALWNGDWGGDLVWLNTSHDDFIFAFTREKSNDKVFVILNLSESGHRILFKGKNHYGKYTELFTKETISFSEGLDKMELAPWEFKVYVKH